MTDDADAKPYVTGSKWRVGAGDASKKIDIRNEGLFDEVVVDGWFHMENMDEGVWWMRIGDVRVMIYVKSEKQAEVVIERGFYGPIDGETTLD